MAAEPVAPAVGSEVVVWAAEPVSPAVGSEVVVWAAEPEAVFVSEPQVSGDIAVAFVVLVPVSVVQVEDDSSGHPKLLAFPNVDCFAISSSSVEVVG